MPASYNVRPNKFAVIAILTVLSNMNSATAVGSGTTTCVSMDSNGNQGVSAVSGSRTPSISTDGQVASRRKKDLLVGFTGELTADGLLIG